MIELNDDLQEQESSAISQFPEDQELIITGVEREPKQKYRYLVSFGQHVLSIHEDIMIKYRMIKGNSFWKQELEGIVLSNEKQLGYVQALKYLERKARTSKEIQIRLKEKETSQEVIEDVLERLTREGLVNDAMYAQQWAEQRITSQRKGKAWIRQELRQKGVDKLLIAEALDGVSPDQEYESALIIGRKKWNQTKGELLDKKRKTGSYLMRRGFPGEQVRRVLNQLIKEDELQDIDDDNFEYE
ncbi:regulatory protein RecX [Paenibacillus macquariensis]|uniref:Regulatory protein RecX n=1 Tax=Paenibacillus macquariensis TaxID=948756 RepID=A0ABY1JZM5_9BACL|nr:regulatory protein RecX [Paenibacillus macquariensis]MEC0091331.1 regulatory protein RecX [Paenibacillus macquariensis]OAB38018.1 RecX family transcriptional regulator [Paenibacillus macquariensis subsp. macquariensis]SIR04491.1 regulatory protein [Paenibacillus macquariensis]